MSQPRAQPILSPDGQFMWTGDTWIPAPPSGPTPPKAADPGPPPGGPDETALSASPPPRARALPTGVIPALMLVTCVLSLLPWWTSQYGVISSVSLWTGTHPHQGARIVALVLLAAGGLLLLARRPRLGLGRLGIGDAALALILNIAVLVILLVAGAWSSDSFDNGFAGFAIAPSAGAWIGLVLLVASVLLSVFAVTRTPGREPLLHR